MEDIKATVSVTTSSSNSNNEIFNSVTPSGVRTCCSRRNQQLLFTSSVLSLQTTRQTQRQPVSSDRAGWHSLESTRPTWTRVWTRPDWPGIAWTTWDKRSCPHQNINTAHRGQSGAARCWESSLLWWVLLLSCVILWLGGAADAWLTVWLAALVGHMMWRVLRRGAVRGGAAEDTKMYIFFIFTGLINVKGYYFT